MNEKWKEIKKASEGLGNNLDLDKAWERFDNSREKDKKRPILWWLYGLGGLALTLLFALTMYFGFWSSNSNDISKVTYPVAPTEISENKSIKEKADTRSKSNSNTSTIQDKEVSKPNLNLVKHKVIDLDKPQETAKINSSNSVGLPTEIVTTQAENFNSVSFSNYSSLSAGINKNEFATNQKNKTAADFLLNTKNSNEDKLAAGTSNAITLLRLLRVLDRLDSKIIYERPVSTFSYSNMNFLFAENAPKAIRQNKNWTFELKYSYALMGRNTDWSPSLFNQRRTEDETLKENNVIEALFSRQLTQNLNIHSGVVVSQFRTTTFEVEQKIENIEFEDVVIYQLISEGEVTEVIGTISGTTTTITERTRHQKYQSLSIPIYLSFNYDLNRNWSTYLSGGFTFGIIQNAKGDIFSSEFSTGEFQPISNLNYRKSGTVEGILGLGIKRKINNSTDASFGLRFSHDLNSRRKEIVDNEKFRSYGLSIGLIRRY